MIVAAGGGERDYAADAAILAALPGAADPGIAAERAAAGRPAADAVPGPAFEPAGGQYLDRARRGRLARARFMGEEAGRRRRGAHRLRAHRRRAGRAVPGRRRLQRRSGPTCCCTTRWRACCGSARWVAGLGAAGRGRRHGAGLGRLLPGDREPRPRRRPRRRADGDDRRRGHRPLPPAPGRGDRERRAPAGRAGRTLRSGRHGGDLRRLRRAAPTAEERAWLRRAGPAGARRRNRVRPLAGSRRSRPPWRSPRWRCSEGRLFPPLEAAEAPMDAPLRQALVTGWGHWRGEALGPGDRSVA